MPEEFVTLFDLFTHTGFVTGLLAGVGALLILYVAGRASPIAIPGWALVVAATSLWVLSSVFPDRPVPVLEIGLLAVAGLFTDLGFDQRRLVSVRVVMFVAAAAVLALATMRLADLGVLAGADWLPIATPLAIAVAGISLRPFQRGPMALILGPMMAVAVFGVWATVPETDTIRVALGATAGLALGTLPWFKWRASGFGVFALIGLVFLVAIDGGMTRIPSIPAAWASFGAFPVVAAAAVWGERFKWQSVLLVHIGMAVLASRVLGDWESMSGVLVGIGVILIAGYAVLHFTSRISDAPANEPEEQLVP